MKFYFTQAMVQNEAAILVWSCIVAINVLSTSLQFNVDLFCTANKYELTSFSWRLSFCVHALDLQVDFTFSRLSFCVHALDLQVDFAFMTVVLLCARTWPPNPNQFTISTIRDSSGIGSRIFQNVEHCVRCPFCYLYPQPVNKLKNIFVGISLSYSVLILKLNFVFKLGVSLEIL